MPDQIPSVNAEDFRLFERDSFLGLEKVLPWSWCRQPTVRGAFLFTVLLAWVPMAVLAAFQGVAWGPSPAQSLLLDVGVYVRFFIAVPLLILSLPFCSSELRDIVKHFLEAKLVKESEQERFSENFAKLQRQRDGRWVDWILLALAYAYIAIVLVQVVPLLPPSWRTMGPEGHRVPSAAGWWLVLVSWPLYLFALFRLLYRMTLWWRFLWGVSKLDLQLNAAIPDGAGGLGFLGLSLTPFLWPAFAIAVSVAGMLANAALQAGASIAGYKVLVFVFAGCNVGLFVGPLLFFYLRLWEARRQGQLKHAVLGGRQIRQFEQEWIRKTPERGDLLSIQDFSAVIDLNSTAYNVRNTSLVPFQWRQIGALIACTLLPFLPVAALQYPVTEILQQVLKLVL